MKLPTRPRRGLEFNITPMIDVVFLLIIFFLVSTHFVHSEAQETVTLPLASETHEEPQPPRQLIITVLPDGTLHAGGQATSLDGIEVMIQENVQEGLDDFGVLIRSDEVAQYSAVEPVLLMCARHGVTKVYFAKRDR